MVTPGTLAGVGVVALINTFVVAVTVRFFRLQLDTRRGVVALGLLLIPVALFVTTAVLTGVLGLGGDVGDRNAVLFLVFLAPSILGIAIDLFLRRPPEPVELPEREDQRR
ncbi:MAG: hypothetical protein ACI9YT_000326 [Halobacteriales archaeon]|jgi:hypothetical protein